MLITRRFSRSIYLSTISLLFGILLTVINLLHLRTTSEETRNLNIPSYFSIDFISARQPVVWITGHENFQNYLSHVIKIFGYLGYKLYIDKSPPNISFDVLWSHQYPFSDPLFSLYLTKLQPYQKVNHIPGSKYYTSKVSLATAGLTLGMPKAFDLPAKQDEFLNYTNTHPDRLWVKKNNEHRGIRIQNIKELNLLDNDSFIQEYISHPFLFDNRKFDIGIYTVITSVLPLLVYIYEEDVLLRFCSKDYEPFDANDVDKYVVGDNYTPLWQMPPLKKYYVEQQMTFQHTFNAYLVELGKDLSLIWNRIKEIIAVVNSILASIYFKKPKRISIPA